MLLFQEFVLTQTLLSLPLFALMVFGAFHVSELSFHLGAVEQTSFFAARSAFVDEEEDDLARLGAQYFFQDALHPIRPEGEPIRFEGEEELVFERAFEDDGTSLCKTQNAYPSALPFQHFIRGPVPRRHQFTSNFQTTIEEGHPPETLVLSGQTPLPKKGRL